MNVAVSGAGVLGVAVPRLYTHGFGGHDPLPYLKHVVHKGLAQVGHRYTLQGRASIHLRTAAA